jgi:hypothetical protein
MTVACWPDYWLKGVPSNKMFENNSHNACVCVVEPVQEESSYGKAKRGAPAVGASGYHPYQR